MHTKFWPESLKGREFARPRHRWKCNIEMNLKETKYEV
jgi:hypothetical protein